VLDDAIEVLLEPIVGLVNDEIDSIGSILLMPTVNNNISDDSNAYVILDDGVEDTSRDECLKYELCVGSLDFLSDVR